MGLGSPTVERRLIQPPDPGIYPDLPMSVYLSWDAVSAGMLKTLTDRSPLHADADRRTDSDSKDTAATIRGTAIHYAILQPSDFEVRYGRLPEGDGRAAHVREAKVALAAEGRIGLPGSVWDAARALRERAWKHAQVRAVLEQAECELSVVWDRDGLACKCRPDVLAREAETIVDLKTCEDASKAAFARTVRRYRYDRSAPWYLDGLNAAGVPVRFWLMLAAESEPPYALALYSLEPEVINRRREENDVALRAWRAVRDLPALPAYPEGVMPLNVED